MLKNYTQYTIFRNWNFFGDITISMYKLPIKQSSFWFNFVQIRKAFEVIFRTIGKKLNTLTNVKWRDYLGVCILVAGFTLFYMIYFYEPIQCSAPDVFKVIKDVNSAQSPEWRILSNLLRGAVNQELDRRGRIGATSTTVNLNDIGVRWHHDGSEDFGNFPGLASLYAIRPQWFHQRGLTNVTQLIAHIGSDTDLHP